MRLELFGGLGLICISVLFLVSDDTLSWDSVFSALLFGALGIAILIERLFKHITSASPPTQEQENPD